MISGDDQLSTEVRHFIELATRPLENHPGLRDEARAELMERLSHGLPSARRPELQIALGSLAKTLPGTWRTKAALLAAVGVILAVVSGLQAWSFYGEIKAMFDFGDRVEAASRAMAEREGAVADPAELEHRITSPGLARLPEDYRETWKAIDPDNGAWAWREAIERAGYWWSTCYSPPWGGDEDFAKAWSLAVEAAKAPQFQTYKARREASLLASAGSPKAVTELMSQVWTRWVRCHGIVAASNNSDGAEYLFLEKGNQCVEADDPAELKFTIQIWKRIYLRLIEASLTIEDLGAAADLLPAAESLEDSAGKLGLISEQEDLRKLRQECQAAFDSLAISGPDFSSRDDICSLDKQALQWKADGELPGSPDYKPGRMMSVATYERFYISAAAVLLLLPLAIVGVESVRRGRRVNGLTAGLAPLFKGSDGLWLLGSGVLVPIAWYFLITRLTPLRIHDLPGRSSLGLASPIQMAATLLLVLVATLATARWRIRVRGGFLGLVPAHLSVGWLMVGLAATLVAAPGIARWLPDGSIQKYLHALLAGCGMILLWLLWQAGTILCRPASAALGGVLLARATVVPLALALAVTVIAQPLLSASAQTWMAKNEITRWDSSRGITAMEAKAVDAAVARCREILGTVEKSAR